MKNGMSRYVSRIVAPALVLLAGLGAISLTVSDAAAQLRAHPAEVLELENCAETWQQDSNNGWHRIKKCCPPGHYVCL